MHYKSTFTGHIYHLHPLLGESEGGNGPVTLFLVINYNEYIEIKQGNLETRWSLNYQENK